MARNRLLRMGPAAMALVIGCQVADLRVDPPPAIEARGQSEDKPTTLPSPADTQPIPSVSDDSGRVKIQAGTKAEAGTKPDAKASISEVAGSPAVVEPTGAKKMPISLDAVLRLAEEQNPSLAAARERVQQACAEQDLAKLRWLPDVNIGVGYYRHEGGIQDQDGRIINSSTGALLGGADLNAKLDIRAAAFAQLDAARKTLQQRGEMKKLSYELTVSATERYIDILAALTGAAVSKQIEAELQKVLDEITKAAVDNPPLGAEKQRFEAEIAIQRTTAAKLESLARQAAIELAHILGIDPCIDLIPVDAQLSPLSLIDTSRPECDMVSQVLANGPGVREVEEILALIHKGIADSQGNSRYMPVLYMQALEAGFGGGPGSGFTFTNRFDVGMQAKWNLTELLGADAQRRIALAGLNQTHLRHAELRSKLTLGVRESVEVIRSGQEQIRISLEGISLAEKSLETSKKRLRVGGLAGGGSYSEILLATRALGLARAGHLAVLRDYDRAQLRLLVLLGK